MQERFYKYELISEIKRSALSCTYLASPLQHPAQRVVVKLFAPAAFALPASREQFQVTIATLLKLKHPSLIPLLDAGIVDNQPYLVSAYWPGGSLREFMALRFCRQSFLDEMLQAQINGVFRVEIFASCAKNTIF